MLAFKFLILAAILVLVIGGKKKGRTNKHNASKSKGDENVSGSQNYDVSHGNGKNNGHDGGRDNGHDGGRDNGHEGRKDNGHVNENKNNYGPPPQQFVPIPIRLINYGPDNAKYRYSAPFYDQYIKQHANVQFNRFPGGVDYSHNVNGYGADVKVSFQSYPSPQGSYSQKG